jgi:hypothetical protein
MNLLERYLQAVGQYLPVKGKDDTLAELRANLMAEIEGREEELGRPLNEAEGRFFEPIKWSQAWDPRELKERTPEPKGKSFASRVADLIVSVLMIAWLLAVPNHPFLVLGPGASLNRLSLGLTPDWHIFYWQIIGLLVLMLPVKAMALFVAEKWRRGLDLTAQAIGILVLVLLVQARSYLVPLRDGSHLPSLANLAQVNYSVNLGFKIVLAISLVKFLWDIWEAILGSRRKATGFVGVF